MILDIAFVAILVASAAALGLELCRPCRLAIDAATDRLALAVPLGLGLLALGTFFLGELGWLTPWSIALLIAPGLAPASRCIAGRGWRSDLTSSNSLGPTLEDRILGLLIAAGLLGTLITALAPVTDGDALAYHLQLPKVFLAEGAIRFNPYQHESAYPLVTELLYAMTLAWRGPVACRLVQWVLGVCLMGNITALARPVLGERARWAGAVVLLVPAISNGMTASLNDVALASFAAAALVAWLAWFDGPDRRRAVLAGVFAGLALGVKYPALVWVGLLTLAMIAAIGFAKRGKPAHLVLFLAATALVGGLWYARAYWLTGNPVYPFFRQVFGGIGFEEVLGAGRRPLGTNPLKLLVALVPMTLDPARFESRWHQFGPAFLLLLPLLPLSRAPRRVWGIVAFGYLFLTLCLTMRQSPRFVLAALGPLAVGVAWVAHWALERRGLSGRVVVGLLIVVLAGESAWAVYRGRHGLAVIAGIESTDSYLTRREPTYRVAAWVGRHLPPAARLIGQDQRGFYFPRSYTIERRHRLRTGVAARGEPPEAIVAAYRAEGFTHLLMCPPVPEASAHFDPALSRALDPWLAGRTPVFAEDIRDPEGVVRRYAIYDLGEPDLVAAAPPVGARR